MLSNKYLHVAGASMFLQHKLSRIFFSAFASILLVLFIVVYWYSVPLINKEVYRGELNASRLALNNVYDLANQMELSLTAYRQEALAGHQRNLVTAIDLSVSYIENTVNEGLQQQLSLADALTKAYQGLRNFKYGKGNYTWVANAQSKILSHPDPKFHQLDASSLTDSHGQLVIPTVIKQVTTQGDGFYSYPWQRLGEIGEGEKLSYMRYLPQWDIFVGTGVYIDDIEQEVNVRRTQAINELRQTIEQIVIAKTGYLFIFDQQGNMLIHPNSNINDTNALALKDPLTNQSILQELIDVADTGRELVYQWDRPTDPNNYSHDKLSLVRYLEGSGWYICSSVYVDELQRSGEVLSKRILTIGVSALLLAIIFAFVFSKWITRPISRLADVATKVSKGDLTLTSEIYRPDELGVLAVAFDDMVEQLRTNIRDLDSKVALRTDALAKTNSQLHQAMEQSLQAQQQLHQAQRINAVGQLAGGLAHDFNNILTIIIGNLVVVQQRLDTDPALNKRLEPAIRAARRGSDITNRLLAFSRRQSLSPKSVDVNKLVVETVELLASSLPSTTKLNTDFSRTELALYIDDSLLENCLINLVLNAKDAMTQGGEITIHVCERLVTDQQENDHDDCVQQNCDQQNCDQKNSEQQNWDQIVTSGSYVEFNIVDNGSGFSPEAMTTAFEPFYTTKPVGQGSGLGLSMVFGFIKQSQGYIKLGNKAEGGAVVSFLLPLLEHCELMSDSSCENKMPANIDFSDQLILLVEDNDDVRAVVRQQLRSFGFKVLEAVDSDEAEQLILSVNGIDAMVSDISMPGRKNGFELANLLKNQLPRSKVVLMSGYAYDEKMVHQDPKMIILRKPFMAAQLRAALEKI